MLRELCATWAWVLVFVAPGAGCLAVAWGTEGRWRTVAVAGAVLWIVVLLWIGLRTHDRLWRDALAEPGDSTGELPHR